MEIVANGETKSLPEGTTVASFLEGLKLPESRVAVERNGSIVPRDRFAEVRLAAGDRIEVVTLVGGG